MTQKYLKQIVAGTRLDSQGEKLSKQLLESLCSSFKGERITLNQEHSVGIEHAGYVENLELILDMLNPGEWSLVGDVYITKGDINEALKGFSISFLEPLIDVEDPDLILNIPYPLYNNQLVISEFAQDQSLKVNKWVKKSADPATIANLLAVTILIIGPTWQQVHNRLISPLIDKFMESHFKSLEKEGVGLEYCQFINYDSRQIEIRFIPPPGKEQYCFTEHHILAGLGSVIDFFKNNDKAHSVGVRRVVLPFDDGLQSYFILRVEYLDGEIELLHSV